MIVLASIDSYWNDPDWFDDSEWPVVRTETLMFGILIVLISILLNPYMFVIFLIPSLGKPAPTAVSSQTVPNGAT